MMNTVVIQTPYAILIVSRTKYIKRFGAIKVEIFKGSEVVATINREKKFEVTVTRGACILLCTSKPSLVINITATRLTKEVVDNYIQRYRASVESRQKIDSDMYMPEFLAEQQMFEQLEPQAYSDILTDSEVGMLLRIKGSCLETLSRATKSGRRTQVNSRAYRG